MGSRRGAGGRGRRHRAAGCEQPHPARGAGAAGVAAGHGRRAARLAAVGGCAAATGCWSWWTRTRAPSCRATRRGCARSSRPSSRGRRRCSRGCTATTTSGRSCARATACGWSTSRASRPRACPSATAWVRRCETSRRCCARSTTSPATSTATSRPATPGGSRRGSSNAREAFLEAYGDHDPRLLRALEVEKETYEFVYAATFLPEWTYAAMGGMRWLMGVRAQ